MKRHLMLPRTVASPIGCAADSASTTNTAVINNAVAKVNQKRGPSSTDHPNLPIADTTVTGGEGDLSARLDSFTGIQQRNIPGRFAGLVERTVPAYSGLTQKFDTTCLKGGDCKDASIEGAGYLGFRLVYNATYAVGECLDVCRN